MTTRATIADANIIKQIAVRASNIHRHYGVNINPAFIESEVAFVHEEVCRLRLRDFLNADNSNFMHDIVGIHRHLNIPMNRFEDCFSPRFSQN